jgi:steroid delta-isomerase-like uncharacterized protein
MSTELIKKYYDAFNRQDYATMLACVSDDVVHEVNEGDVQKGIGLFKDFLGVMDTHYSEQVKNLAVFSSETPGRFAAEFNIDGRYIKSQKGLPEANNQPYFIRVGAFLEVQGSKIARITNYYNLQNWIKAVAG